MASKRASSTKKQGNIGKLLVIKDGKKYEILAEDDRMYYCGDTQFLKTNKDVVGVEDAPKKEAEAEDEKEAE